jgi:hypothetical protein
MTTYYVSVSQGDDANSGLAPDEAFATLAHLRSIATRNDRYIDIGVDSYDRYGKLKSHALLMFENMAVNHGKSDTTD